MKKIALSLLLAALAVPAAASPSPLLFNGDCGTPGKDGTPGAPLTGVINTYYPGTPGSTVPANTANTQIPVGAPTGSSTLVGSGDLVLIIQMQDAAIDSSNSADYGDGPGGLDAQGSTNIGTSSAGYYEYAVVTGPVAGGLLPVEGRGTGGGLLRSYVSSDATAGAGQKRFQVVRVPQFISATLSSTLTARPWDGSTGGILAMDVQANLDLNGATVSVLGHGFRGGAGEQLSGDLGQTPTPANFDYRIHTRFDTSGNKGEGVAGTPRFVFNPAAAVIVDTLTGLPFNDPIDGYPDGSRGRGAPANAGGGGNSNLQASNTEESGGGGGANGGFGGWGGLTYATSQTLGGFGGAALPASLNRIFMGGGGGSGGKNSAAGDSHGGAGGGIVFIRTGTVSGSGTINADGQAGSVANLTDFSSDSKNNGGGGGGGGGTIVFTALSSPLTNLTLLARGGQGGNAGSGPDARGPGGGGGGGVILASSAPSGTSSAASGPSGITSTGSYGSVGGNNGLGSNGILDTTATLPDVGPGQIPGTGSGAECSAVTIDDPTADEATGTITFTVTCPPSGGTVTVTYATQNGTATAGADYTADTNTISFVGASAVIRTLPITITVNNDAIFEAAETILVNLTGSTGAAIGDPQGVGTITDNDTAPLVQWTSSSQSGPETNAATFTVTAEVVGATEVAVVVPILLSGTATQTTDYTFASSPLTIPAGSANGSVTVTVVGDNVDEANETVILTLGTPQGGSATLGATTVHTVTIDDDDADPTISIADAQAPESAPNLTLTVTLSTASQRTITVDYVTSDGTALAGSDYTAVTPTTLTFNPGETSKTIDVPLINDGTNEPGGDETFNVTLSNPGPAGVTIADNLGVGSIQDDDSFPIITIDDLPNIAEGDSGTSLAVFTVTLSTTSGNNIVVNYQTQDVTATAGSDYVAATGFITINSGSTTGTISITINGDVLNELSETFNVNLSTPDPLLAAVAAGPSGVGTGTIVDVADPQPTISIGDVVIQETNSGTTTATFAVTLSAASGQTITASFATADGTASTATDNDYVAQAGTVTFVQGDVSELITITVNGDTNNLEGDETFFVNLSNLVNVLPGDLQGQATITNDDTPADLRVTKTVNNTAPSVGDSVVYTVNIFYSGPEDALNVTVVDLIPAGLTLVGVPSPSQGTYDPATGVWSVGTLVQPPAGSETQANLIITCTPEPGTGWLTLVNTATIGSGVQNDTNAQNNTASVAIQVVIPPLQITTSPTPAPVTTVDSAYAQTFTAIGGIAPYTWTISNMVAPGGNPFPFGLNPATGLLSGTPSVVGDYTFDLEVQDSLNPANTDTESFTITVVAIDALLPPTINASPAPPQGMAGVPYSHIFTATNVNPGPPLWSITAGSLPAGLALDPSTGTVSGTPQAAGTSTFTLRVVDEHTGGLAAADFDDLVGVSITIVPNPVSILTTAIPPGVQNVFYYSQIIQAQGGIGPFTWSVVTPPPPGQTALPPGISLAGSGRSATLSGTPTAVGTYVFTLRITDNGQASVSDDQTLILLISPPPLQPQITTVTLPDGNVGIAYPATQLTAIGGSGVYTWSVAAGTLPAGLTLDPATGILDDTAGLPSEEGVFQLLIQITDSDGQTDVQEVTLTIWPPLNIITPPPLPVAVNGNPYSVEIRALGGKQPYTWSIVGGALPTGLSIHPLSGFISGTPTSAGTNPVTVRVTDENNVFDEQDYTITFAAAGASPTVVTRRLPTGYLGVPYSASIHAVGGTAPYSNWQTVSGSLPSGIGGPNAFTGLVTGTPNAVMETTDLVVTVDGANGATSPASDTISMKVKSFPEILSGTLPDGFVGEPYSADLIGSGGTAPYSWGVVRATIPPGLNLASGASGGKTAGAFGGVPPAPGVWLFKVEMTDADGDKVEKIFAITIRLRSPTENSLHAGYCGGSAAAAPSLPAWSLWTILILGGALLLAVRRPTAS